MRRLTADRTEESFRKEYQAWLTHNLPHLNADVVPVTTLHQLYPDETMFGPNYDLANRVEGAMKAFSYVVITHNGSLAKESAEQAKLLQDARILFLSVKDSLTFAPWDLFNYWLPASGNYDFHPWTRTAYAFHEFKKSIDRENRSLYGSGDVAFQLGVSLTATPELLEWREEVLPKMVRASHRPSGNLGDVHEQLFDHALRLLEKLEAFNRKRSTADEALINRVAPFKLFRLSF